VAYVVLRALRQFGLAGTEMAQAQCGTIRTKLLKIGAVIRVSVRRVVVAADGRDEDMPGKNDSSGKNAKPGKGK
jgi:hypothetical protein